MLLVMLTKQELTQDGDKSRTNQPIMPQRLPGTHGQACCSDCRHTEWTQEKSSQADVRGREDVDDLEKVRDGGGSKGSGVKKGFNFSREVAKRCAKMCAFRGSSATNNHMHPYNACFECIIISRENEGKISTGSNEASVPPGCQLKGDINNYVNQIPTILSNRCQIYVHEISTIASNEVSTLVPFEISQ
ncbi:hypothetical protein MAR_035204 [Mya arenaria]|uniref:Uncharacterized protein n=1 Tax=Mya arenaria TaxID=6604 RepID=A0ABY7EJG4_MYAAR|nr:hypothetical protein MAR_035204 [Mya arenaria]